MCSEIPFAINCFTSVEEICQSALCVGVAFDCQAGQSQLITRPASLALILFEESARLTEWEIYAENQLGNAPTMQVSFKRGVGSRRAFSERLRLAYFVEDGPGEEVGFEPGLV